MKTRKPKIPKALLGLLYVAATICPVSSSTAKDFPYVARLTCTLSGQEFALLQCFIGSRGGPGTELELSNGDDYGLYKAMELDKLGRRDGNSLEIDLTEGFSLTAQNASEDFVLGVKIVDKLTRKKIYEKQVGRFGVIDISD